MVKTLKLKNFKTLLSLTTTLVWVVMLFFSRPDTLLIGLFICISFTDCSSWCKIFPLWGSIHFSISIYWLIGIKHKHLALEGIPSGHWKQNVNTQNIQNIFFYSFPSVIPFSFPWHVFHNVKIPRNYREWDRLKLKVVTQPKV